VLVLAGGPVDALAAAGVLGGKIPRRALGARVASRLISVPRPSGSVGPSEMRGGIGLTRTGDIQHLVVMPRLAAPWRGHSVVLAISVGVPALRRHTHMPGGHRHRSKVALCCRGGTISAGPGQRAVLDEVHGWRTPGR